MSRAQVSIWSLFALLTLVLLGSVALAQRGRSGGEAEVRFTHRADQPSLIEVRVSPTEAARGELFYYTYNRDRRRQGGAIRGVVPASAPGYYRIPITYPEPGLWGLSIRHGVGIDLYEVWLETPINPAREETRTFSALFRGGLPADVPSYVQPAGFVLFALILLLSLACVVRVLAHLRRQGAATLT